MRGITPSPHDSANIRVSEKALLFDPFLRWNGRCCKRRSQTRCQNRTGDAPSDLTLVRRRPPVSHTTCSGGGQTRRRLVGLWLAGVPFCGIEFIVLFGRGTDSASVGRLLFCVVLLSKRLVGHLPQRSSSRAALAKMCASGSLPPDPVAPESGGGMMSFRIATPCSRF